MPIGRLVGTINRNVLEWLVKRLSERVLDYFEDLPSAFSIGGFLDQAELLNVRLNVQAVSAAMAAAGLPFRLKEGHVRQINLALVLTRGQTHLVLRDFSLIFAPSDNTSATNPEAVLRTSLNDLRDALYEILAQMRSHILGRENDPSFEMEDGGQSGNQSRNQQADGTSSLRKFALGDILGWLFRYDPSLNLTVEHLTISYEDDAPHMNMRFKIEKICLRPSNKFWTMQWPTDQDAETLNVGPSSSKDSGSGVSSQFISEGEVTNISINLKQNMVDDRGNEVPTETNILSPISCEVQFGVQSLKSSHSTSDGGDKSNNSFRLSVKFRDEILVNIGRSFCSAISRIQSFCALHARWRRLRTFRPWQRPGQGADSFERRACIKAWWTYASHHLVRSVRQEKGESLPLQQEVSDRVSARRRYIRTIRRWLLDDHQALIKRRELIRTITDLSEVSAKEAKELATGLTGGLSLMEILVMGTPSLEKTKTSLADEAALKHTAWGRFYLMSYEELQQRAQQDSDMRFVLEQCYKRSASTLALWHLLALEETRHLLAKAEVNGSAAFPLKDQRTYFDVDPPGFTSLIHRILRGDETAAKKRPLLQRNPQFWSKARERLRLWAEALEEYIVLTGDTATAEFERGHLIPFSGLFHFLDRWDVARQIGSRRGVEFLTKSQLFTDPLERISHNKHGGGGETQATIRRAVKKVHKDSGESEGVLPMEIPWERIVSGASRVPSWIRALIDGQEMAIPRCLKRNSFCCVLHGGLSVCLGDMTGPSFCLQVEKTGVEVSCQSKLTVRAAVQGAELRCLSPGADSKGVLMARLACGDGSSRVSRLVESNLAKVTDDKLGGPDDEDDDRTDTASRHSHISKNSSKTGSELMRFKTVMSEVKAQKVKLAQSWISCDVTLLSYSMVANQWRLKLPIFFSGDIHIPDLDIMVHPQQIDLLRRLLVEYTKSYIGGYLAFASVNNIWLPLKWPPHDSIEECLTREMMAEDDLLYDKIARSRQSSRPDSQEQAGWLPWIESILVLVLPPALTALRAVKRCMTSVAEHHAGVLNAAKAPDIQGLPEWQPRYRQLFYRYLEGLYINYMKKHRRRQLKFTESFWIKRSRVAIRPGRQEDTIQGVVVDDTIVPHRVAKSVKASGFSLEGISVVPTEGMRKRMMSDLRKRMQDQLNPFTSAFRRSQLRLMVRMPAVTIHLLDPLSSTEGLDRASLLTHEVLEVAMGEEQLQIVTGLKNGKPQLVMRLGNKRFLTKQGIADALMVYPVVHATINQRMQEWRRLDALFQESSVDVLPPNLCPTMFYQHYHKTAAAFWARLPANQDQPLDSVRDAILRAPEAQGGRNDELKQSDIMSQEVHPQLVIQSMAGSIDLRTPPTTVLTPSSTPMEPLSVAEAKSRYQGENPVPSPSRSLPPRPASYLDADRRGVVPLFESGLVKESESSPEMTIPNVSSDRSTSMQNYRPSASMSSEPKVAQQTSVNARVSTVERQFSDRRRSSAFQQFQSSSSEPVITRASLKMPLGPPLPAVEPYRATIQVEPAATQSTSPALSATMPATSTSARITFPGMLPGHGRGHQTSTRIEPQGDSRPRKPSTARRAPQTKPGSM